jgi:hypothetical protein
MATVTVPAISTGFDPIRMKLVPKYFLGCACSEKVWFVKIRRNFRNRHIEYGRGGFAGLRAMSGRYTPRGRSKTHACCTGKLTESVVGKGCFASRVDEKFSKSQKG